MTQRGPLAAVILDWAGTTVDFGSRAPAQVFVEIFRRRGVAVTEAEARGPMGRAKRDHIAAVLHLPRVAAAWREVTGNAPAEADVDSLYAEFLPLQKEVLARHADVIPGVPEAIAECRRRGLRIGSTTGYTRELMEVVVPLARTGGYEADAVVCADDVPQGRPAPWMILRAAEQLGAYPPSALVIVDDTPVGIEAGRNAGTWTVGVALTGNACGLSAAELAALPEHERAAVRVAARRQFAAAGADFTIDGVGDLLPVLDEIAARAGHLRRV